MVTEQTNGSWIRLQGGILIVVLWTLLLLAALAVAAAAYVGGQVEVARRLGGRVVARQVARGGVEHGLAILMRETNGWEALSEPWADNPSEFRDVSQGGKVTWTAYYFQERADGAVVTNYGLLDEQGRIDVNFARFEVLGALFRVVGGVDPDRANVLAKAITEGRTPLQPGQGTLGLAQSVWVSGEFENGPFMSIYELLWIHGMTRDLFDRVAPHITVHGGSRVNINTASFTVLRVLAAAKGREGSDDLIRKILQFRDGGGIFKTFFGAGLAGEKEGEPVLPAEAQAVLNGMAPFATVASDRFRGRVLAGKGAGRADISFVWDRRERRFLYWHED